FVRAADRRAVAPDFRRVRIRRGRLHPSQPGPLKTPCGSVEIRPDAAPSVSVRAYKRDPGTKAQVTDSGPGTERHRIVQRPSCAPGGMPGEVGHCGPGPRNFRAGVHLKLQLNRMTPTACGYKPPHLRALNPIGFQTELLTS